jgi:hypothetical protein
MPGPNSLLKKLHFVPEEIATGAAKNFDARGFSYFTVLAPNNSIVTFSRVMSMSASAHVNDPGAAQTIMTTDTISAIPVDWPFYRVSTETGPCQVAFV